MTAPALVQAVSSPRKQNSLEETGPVGHYTSAWSSFAHAAVMGAQALLNMVPRGELVGVGVLVVIGVALMALAPAGLPHSATR
jgi:hypothetical protein